MRVFQYHFTTLLSSSMRRLKKSTVSKRISVALSRSWSRSLGHALLVYVAVSFLVAFSRSLGLAFGITLSVSDITPRESVLEA